MEPHATTPVYLLVTKNSMGPYGPIGTRISGVRGMAAMEFCPGHDEDDAQSTSGMFRESYRITLQSKTDVISGHRLRVDHAAQFLRWYGWLCRRHF